MNEFIDEHVKGKLHAFMGKKVDLSAKRGWLYLQDTMVPGRLSPGGMLHWEKKESIANRYATWYKRNVMDGYADKVKIWCTIWSWAMELVLRQLLECSSRNMMMVMKVTAAARKELTMNLRARCEGCLNVKVRLIERHCIHPMMRLGRSSRSRNQNQNQIE